MAEDQDNEGAVDGSPTGSRDGVGATLVVARERQGMTREDVASHTRIAERHLVAIEEDRFGDLAGKTYAVGFSRAYAKAVGLDEAEIADRVRNQITPQDYEPRHVANFEPGDPARVPPSALAWIAGLAAIGVIVALFFVWDSLFSPEAEMPSLIADRPQQSAPATAPRPAPAPAPVPRGGVVAMKAMAPNVWVKVTNAAGEQVFQKELSQGEVYTVPSDADGPVLRTGRPDALELSIDGRPLPRLEDSPVIVSNVPLGADQLRARLSGQGGAVPAPAPAANPTPRPSPVASGPAPRQPAPVASSSSARVAAEAAAPRPVSTDSE